MKRLLELLEESHDLKHMSVTFEEATTMLLFLTPNKVISGF